MLLGKALHLGASLHPGANWVLARLLVNMMRCIVAAPLGCPPGDTIKLNIVSRYDVSGENSLECALHSVGLISNQ